MNPIAGMVLACCLFVSLFFRIRLGFAQMDHSVEDGTAEATFDLLIGLGTRLERVADEVLIAIDLCFGQRTSMIATGLFPPLASLSSNSSQDLIALQRGPLQLSCCWIIASLRRAMIGRIGGPPVGVANASNTLCLSYAPSPLPPPPPPRLEPARGLPAKHHRSDGTSTSGRPPRRWPR